ncbi:hypothetical protein Scep_025832 [Stephania cephalantha]|uniref:Uncharacterized protein n=1 Tax=Stephania cephalantha TaxID=152367 RepID=A0AAP0HMN5_9MAGN
MVSTKMGTQLHGLIEWDGLDINESSWVPLRSAQRITKCQPKVCSTKSGEALLKAPSVLVMEEFDSFVSGRVLLPLQALDDYSLMTRSTYAALEQCLYFHTKDHDDVTFLDERVERIVTAIRNRRIELTQSQLDTLIDETELYLSVVERDNKGQTYGLGWTPSGSRRRHAEAGAGDGARSSRPISAPNEPIKLLRMDFKEMQTNLLRVIQDNTLTRDELREVLAQLRRMEHALMDRLYISFTPPRDVPDDSETDDDPDD